MPPTMTVTATLPPPVRPGDRVGVAALSGPVDPDRLARGLGALEALGFEPVLAANLDLRTEDGLHAGSDEERLEAFHALAAEPDLAAIVFARGGHGVLRLLPSLDWDLLARRPRAYVGYSDLTPFLLEVVRRLGLTAFHGPMVAADFARGLSPEEAESFLAVLAGRLPREVPLAGGRGRAVEGPLLGGCLSLLVSTLGTGFAPDLAGALLFLEDVDEPRYRIDRMLTHLVLSNKLEGIQGMLLGHMTHEAGTQAVAELPRWIDQAVAVGGSASRAPEWSLGWGLPAGHRAPNQTLPLGLPARLDPDTGRLIVGRA